jgi:hypothetical protein
VFRVSGTIELRGSISIRNPFVTIAGQTAPGDGICLANHALTVADTHDVVIRFLRLRPGDRGGKDVDSFGARGVKNLMVDHCSASWSIDECVTLYANEDTTVQWCLVSESLWESHHQKGAHGMGGVWGGRRGSYHHNLLAHHNSRNPRIAGGDPPVDYRNNVIYNWGNNSAYGGENSQVNMVGNFYKPGPATSQGSRNRILDGPNAGSRWYLADNFVEGDPTVTADNWLGVHRLVAPIEQIRADEPFPFAPVRTQSAAEAYSLVLSQVGATLPRRDAVDARVIDEVRTGTARFGKKFRDGGVGIVDSQDDVGGWPLLESATPPIDSDHDGMPDAWESVRGLDPQNPKDGAEDRDGDGYTNVEEYLNSLVPPENYGL